MAQCLFKDGEGPQCTNVALDRKNLCKQHFIDLWWTWKESPESRDSFHQPDGNVVGLSTTPARRDLRNLNPGRWTLTVAANIKDRFFEFNSAPFAIEKGLRKLVSSTVVTVSNSQTDFYCSRPNANGAQGHSYFRLKADGIDECFGFIAGLTGEDPYGSPEVMAKSNQLCIDYSITNAQKNAICTTISEWIFYGYDLNARNCTEFAKAACTAADIWWPAYGLPVLSNQTGSLGIVQTPNNLYLALQLSPYSYDPLFEGEHTHAPQSAMAIYATKQRVALAGLAVSVAYGISYIF
jgi:hypothetical protein